MSLLWQHHSRPQIDVLGLLLAVAVLVLLAWCGWPVFVPEDGDA